MDTVLLVAMSTTPHLFHFRWNLFSSLFSVVKWLFNRCVLKVIQASAPESRSLKFNFSQDPYRSDIGLDWSWIYRVRSRWGKHRWNSRGCRPLGGEWISWRSATLLNAVLPVADLHRLVTAGMILYTYERYSWVALESPLTLVLPRRLANLWIKSSHSLWLLSWSGCSSRC